MRMMIYCSLVLAVAAHAAEPEVINAEARFPEGPAWHDGRLYYAEYGGHTILSWDGESNSVFWEQNDCGPAAVAPTPEGEFLVTCYDASTLVRVSATGETLATHAEDSAGRPFEGPNDLTVAGDGTVYFTASGPWESEPIVGRVYRLATDGTITAVADDLHYANGIALSADGGTLYVAESEAYRIIQFTVQPDGRLTDRRLLVRLADMLDGQTGHYPDGIKLDEAGNLYIGLYSSGRIVVVNPAGELQRIIEVPSAAAPNLAFNPDQTEVYVMAVDETEEAPWYGKVYRVLLD